MAGLRTLQTLSSTRRWSDLASETDHCAPPGGTIAVMSFRAVKRFAQNFEAIISINDRDLPAQVAPHSAIDTHLPD